MDATELLQAILDSPTQHAIIVTDPDGIIKLWNKGAARIFLYEAEEIIGTNIRALFSPDDLGHDIPDREMDAASRDGCAGDFRWHMRKDGAFFWADGMIYPVRRTTGEQLGYVKIVRDATEQKKSGEEVSRLALMDSLTGLPNRAEFRNRFVDMAASAQRHGEQLIMLLIDLDRFKAVNDGLGHLAGDALLQHAAHRIRATVRDTDFVARMGGDEFVVLQPDAQSADVGGRLAEAIVESLSRPFRIHGQEVRIGASIGVSVYPQDAEELDPLFHKADVALYKAKTEGRNRYQYYTELMDLNAHWRGVEHAQLIRAVKNRAFSLEYQPRVDTISGEVVAVEALLRCSHPFFAEYPIEKIVALAVETGRMRRLGLWALSEASRQTRKWQLEGARHLILTMNFCRNELADTKFGHRVTRLMARSGLSPADLEIDIPAGQLTSDLDTVQISLLGPKGVSVAIDNFGDGGVVLDHLSELPFSTLKLDLRFVPDIPADPRSCAIASAIIELAHALGCEVAAERIESEQQAEFFKHRCETVQGYHFGRPMSADDMSAWLKANALGGNPPGDKPRRSRVNASRRAALSG